MLSSIDVVEPDLLYVANDQQDILTESNVSGPPSLVVEVLSSSTRRRDETLKLELYGRMGVREYWIVDPDLETFTVYRAADDRFARIGELSIEANDALSSPMFPGLALPLSSVFRGQGRSADECTPAARATSRLVKPRQSSRPRVETVTHRPPGGNTDLSIPR